MADFRILRHPILQIPSTETVSFRWRGIVLQAKKNEVISSALFANGIHIFGYHHKDSSPQGIFCANGQCAQCMVIADGFPVKACMTHVHEGMVVEPLDNIPALPEIHKMYTFSEIPTIHIPVLIIGGGPAGLSAAQQLGKYGIQVILIDDKNQLGGKLVLQTHRFFGSINAVYAGTRGIDIAKKLEKEVLDQKSIEIWLNSTALAVFSDKKVGILKNNKDYVIVKPQILLNAAGAREKYLTFKGNTLPGVYGAGAFQTLVNRDLVRAAERLFIVGGGNVGLIAGYHALQVGIQVIGLVEALEKCGGYKVHEDKLVRMGVPIYTSHTILSANGSTEVESVTVAKIDKNFLPINGTEKSFDCDTVLIAVGLDPVNEFAEKAKSFGMTMLSAGDADEIAEASSAMFSGKIRGLEIAGLLQATDENVPQKWIQTAKILKSHPGEIQQHRQNDRQSGVMPVFHCTQEIPCNPCTSVCPQTLIKIDEEDIRKIPEFIGEYLEKECIGCEKCVTICPGLAITLVDFRQADPLATVTLPFEFLEETIHPGEQVSILGVEGDILGQAEVKSVRAIKANDHTLMVKLLVPRDIAKRVAGIQIQAPWIAEPLPEAVEHLDDNEIVCRCERVSAGEVRQLIQQGFCDMNEIKAITRAGMGACQGKTCSALILRLFREAGIPHDEVTDQVKRPLFIEAPLSSFAGLKRGDA